MPRRPGPRERAPPSVHHVVPEWVARRDVELLLAADAVVEGLPTRLRRFLRGLVHPNPLRDVSLVLYFVFAAALPEGGFAYFWQVVRNALVCVLVQTWLRVRPPAAYAGRRLWTARRWGALAMEPLGALCAEAFMGAAVVLPLGALWHPAVVAALALLAVSVSCTRLYSGSRYCYQVGLGLFFGVLAAVLGPVVGSALPRLSRKQNTLAAAAALLPLLALMGLEVENNTAWAFNVPRSEFSGVLQGIASAPVANERTDERGLSKKDSYYHLVSSLQHRRAASDSEGPL